MKPSKSKDNTFQKTQAGFKAKTEKSEYSGLLRRPFSPKKEISKERFAASALRVQRNASENNCYTLEPSNRFEYINPKYRKVNKAKWVGKVIATQHDFFRFAKEMCKDDSSWKITDISSKEPYIDGFEVTGNLSRKREKNKELQSDFCASFARDTWNKNFPRPISNSTYFSVLKSKSLIKSSKLYPKSFEASKNSLIQ